MNENTCQVCGEEVDDIRHISIDCFYNLSEVSDRWQVVDIPGKEGQFGKRVYTLLVCKGCRAVFMFDFLKLFIERGGEIRRKSRTDTNGNQEISLAEYTRRQDERPRA